MHVYLLLHRKKLPFLLFIYSEQTSRVILPISLRCIRYVQTYKCHRLVANFCNSMLHVCTAWYIKKFVYILFFRIPHVKYCIYSPLSGSKTPHVLPPRNCYAHARFPSFVPASTACVLQPSLRSGRKLTAGGTNREKTRHTSISVAVSRNEVMWRFRPWN